MRAGLTLWVLVEVIRTRARRQRSRNEFRTLETVDGGTRKGFHTLTISHLHEGALRAVSHAAPPIACARAHAAPRRATDRPPRPPRRRLLSRAQTPTAKTNDG